MSAFVLCLTATVATAQQTPGQAHSVVPLNIEQQGGTYQIALQDGRIIRRTDARIADARLIAVPDSTVDLALWTEQRAGQTTPYYAISMNGRTFATPRPTSYQLKALHGDFEPLSEQPQIENGLAATSACHDYIVQFVVQPLEVFREQIRALGGEVYDYFPHHAHIVKMDAATKAQVEALPYVRAVRPYHPAYRLESGMIRALEGNGPTLETKKYRIEVVDGGDAVKQSLANKISDVGGVIEKYPGGGILFEATLTPGQLRQVAQMDEVLFINEWTPPQSRMNNVRIVGGANYLESVAGYTGAGVRAEVMDNGCQTDHPDFAGRIGIRGNTSFAVQTHGTATFGIVFGSGAGSSSARGMLPDAFGYFNDWNYSGSRYDDIGQLNDPPYDCVFQSNSWGYADTPYYTGVSAEMDHAVFDHDIVILHSMGNTGTTSGVEQAWAKNVVGVGGVIHFNDANTANDTWNTGAGTIGPAYDGRMKPDLCYYYDAIRTTYPTDSYTNNFGGTSAACPETAGHFGLFFQMWADGIFGNTVLASNTVFENRPHNSTARAMMFNTAQSYPFSGLADPLTRVHQGWGLANVQNLYDRRNNMVVIDETDVLAPLASKQYGRTIDFGQPGNDQLRVTLVWTDIQGTTSASQHRINNLDLKVTSPLGSVFWGNNGLMEGNWSAAGGSPNTLDTTENVFIQNPIGGNWNIEVIAAEINQDGHVETPEVDADYALVISGGVDCPGPQFAAQPPATMYECYGNDVTLSATVTDYNSLQWYHDGTPISGETGPTLDITGLSPADEGEYWLEATNDCVTYRTDGTMLLDPGTPTVTQQPTQPTPRCEGEDTYLTVAAGGVGPFTYQWYHDGVPAPSATSATLSLLPAQASDAGDWFCEISNACNSVDSDTVTLVINPLPSFLVQPADTCASVGDTVVLTTDVTPDAGVYIQWRKESSSDTFGTSETLTLNNVQAADADDYYVVAFTLNPTCIAESDRATLTVATGLTCSSTMGDLDGDGDYDLYDMSKFMQCYGTDVSGDFCCACANLEDSDTIIDNADWAAMESLTTGPQ